MRYIPNETKNLIIFSDACGGQSRNHSLVRMLMTVTDNKLFENIIHYYPLRGHSFLPLIGILAKLNAWSDELTAFMLLKNILN